MIQRFLKDADLKTALQRFFDVQADFVIGDPTEIERAHARKTDYVGQLTEGQTRGFWLLTLATPLRGRALPCNFLTYSSATLGRESTSRNLEHQRAVAQIRTTIGSRPVVFDREFSYLSFLRSLQAEGIDFVIRLNLSKKLDAIL